MSNKFIFDKTITGDLKGESSWKSPSNIALVKYWGKKDLQIPKNPSLSFTLSNCFTICKIKFNSSNVSDKTEFELYFEGKKEISFEKKMKLFFERIKVYCPYLSSLKIIVETNNSFPHSSGKLLQLQHTVLYHCVLWTLKRLLTLVYHCLLYTSPSPRDRQKSRMPSSA